MEKSRAHREELINVFVSVANHQAQQVDRPELATRHQIS
jgi:hypothetical protein